MDLKGFTDLGNDIGRRVNDAVNSGDFGQLNRDIKRQFEQAFGGNMQRGDLDGKLYHPEHPMQAKTKTKSLSRKQNISIPVASKLPSKAVGVVLMILGYGMVVVFGGAELMLVCSMGFLGTLLPGISGAELATAGSGMLVSFIIAGIVLAAVGTKKYRFASRIRNYLQALGNRTFCTIKELAQNVGKSVRFVVRDLKKIIERGYFPEGHLDDQKTNFIGTNEMYQQYLQARESAKQMAENPQPQNNTMPEFLQKVIEEGRTYIKTIQDANDAIYDPVISEKLFRMEIVVKKIFDYVQEHPDQISQLRRFMNYYMPTTEKLVKAYQKLDQETLQGQNRTAAKQEIADTLDTINVAYEKLYDSMYVDIAMDVSSDISVLKTIFTQEGLMKDELNGGNKDE